MPALSIFGMVVFGLAFAAGGVGVIWWALFRDKSRGRRRCPKCWHDLSHTPGLVCGECGHVARKESDFLRTRRRWAVAAASLAVVLTVTGWTRLEVTSAGWASLMPSFALIGAVGFMEPESSMEDGWRELGLRIRRHELSAAAQVALADRLADLRDGTAVRAAPADLLALLMRTRPGEFDVTEDMNTQQIRALDDALRGYRRSLDHALADVPIDVDSSLPDEWTAGVPLAVTVRGILWGPRTEWRVRVQDAAATPVDATGAAAGPPIALQPLRDDWRVWSAAGGLSGFGPPAAVLETTPAPSGRQRVAINLELQVRRWDWAAEAWGAWGDAQHARVERVVKMDASAPTRGVETGAILDAMHAAFDGRVTGWPDDTRPIGVHSDPSAFSAAEYSDFLLGVVLELCEDGEPRRRLRFWCHGGPSSRNRSPMFWSTELEDVPALRRLRADATGWTIRVRGDQATALRAVPAAPAGTPTPAATTWRTWSGSFELPVVVIPSREPAPNRTWRLDPR